MPVLHHDSRSPAARLLFCAPAPSEMLLGILGRARRVREPTGAAAEYRRVASDGMLTDILASPNSSHSCRRPGRAGLFLLPYQHLSSRHHPWNSSDPLFHRSRRCLGQSLTANGSNRHHRHRLRSGRHLHRLQVLRLVFPSLGQPAGGGFAGSTTSGGCIQPARTRPSAQLALDGVRRRREARIRCDGEGSGSKLGCRLVRWRRKRVESEWQLDEHEP